MARTQQFALLSDMVSKVRRLYLWVQHTLANKFKRDRVHIGKAINLEHKGQKLSQPRHSEKANSLIWLANHLTDCYEQIGDIGDLEEIIVLEREALQLRPQGHPDRAISLANLAISLYARYNQLGVTQDLDEAIVLDQKALDLRPQDHPDRLMLLNNLAIRLSIRYTQLGGMEDLSNAIILGRETLQLGPQGHPDRPSLLNNLAHSLFTRYDQLGVIEDLSEAITHHQEALGLRPQGHPDRPMSLTNLALCLSARYDQLGAMEDLSDAIVLDREALELRPQGHSNRSTSLNNLAASLSTRYNQLGAMDDLSEAIDLQREALKLRPQGHPDRSIPLNNLAYSLSTRYSKLGVMEDLSMAIVLHQESLELQPQGHPDRSASLINLALCLSTRYKRLGAMEDLSKSIVLDREALGLRPQGHPARSMSLNNLAVSLSTRYNQLGVLDDLNEAIVLEQEALELRPQGHPDRSMSLSNLALFMFAQYDQLGVTEDLSKAIVLEREALELRPHGHPDRSLSLNCLASHLFARYDQLGVMDNLSEAIDLQREALALRPEGHPDRSTTLIDLAICLSSRYNQLGITKDLSEAIVLSREALELRPQGHPQRSVTLNNLARRLYLRFRKSHQLEDKEEAFSLYAQMVDLPPVVSFDDISVAKRWICVAEEHQHITTILAYETFLRLLTQHLASLPSLPRHLPILKELSSSLAADAFSACLRNSSPVKAVELLEQGRALFWSQLSRLRSPLDDLIASGTAGKLLADQFTQLASQIRAASNLPGPYQHEQLYNLNFEVHKVVAEIRSLPGFGRFLHPPLFADLQRAASGGPVIIVNASQYSCDALIVLLDRDPVHIPFQTTWESVRDLAKEIQKLAKHATKADMTRQLMGFLRKLWDQIVSPIVEVLRTTCPPHSRIWWCPTADFSLLPLHAATPYRKGQKGLPELYISSYIPTLTALIRARQRDSSRISSTERKFVAIGQANAAGQGILPSVEAELANIGQLVGGITTFTSLAGEESCISRAVEELDRNEWVHFACHGVPKDQPFESGFALHDGQLTIERLIGCDLKNAEFAYLSACHTTVGDEESPDEVIHLASAMQFIGFRSVIGTMWAVDDKVTNKITSTFYKHMVDEDGRLDHTRAACALNETMRTVDILLDQRMLYVHLGA